jgi:hypothetical protein
MNISAPARGYAMRKEAILYEGVDDRLRCLVCNRKCLIPEGGRGYCLTRENRDGRIYSLTYGEVSSAAVGLHREETSLSLPSRDPCIFTWKCGL